MHPLKIYSVPACPSCVMSWDSKKPVAVILNKEDAGLKISPEQVAGDLGLSGRRDAEVRHDIRAYDGRRAKRHIRSGLMAHHAASRSIHRGRNLDTAGYTVSGTTGTQSTGVSHHSRQDFKARLPCYREGAKARRGWSIVR